MKRVLQLLPREADEESVWTAESLRRGLADSFEISRRVLGRGGDWRNRAIAALSLRRSCHQFDLIHAWGGQALSAACMGSRVAMVFTPEPQLADATMRRLRAAQQRRPISVIASCEAQRRWLIEHGALAGNCRMIRPSMQSCPPGDHATRASHIRKRLGLCDEDYVLLAAGESTRESAHELAVWAASILRVADPRYRLLICGRGPHAPAVRRFAENVAPGVLCDAAAAPGSSLQFDQLICAANTVFLTARGLVATMPVGQCMSAGVPIVAAHSPVADELLRDEQTALMAPAQPRLLAQRVLDLVETPAIAKSLSAAAQQQARQWFDPVRFIEEHRAIYDSRIKVAGPSLTS